jgi:hypothetical protein
MGVILRHFLRLTSPEMPPVFKDSGPRKGARGGEREFGTFAPVANEVEFIRKAAPPTRSSPFPAGRIAQAGLFNRRPKRAANPPLEG